MSYAEKLPPCVGCPAFEAGRSYVPGTGNPNALVALIGQGPGREEAEGHWDIPTQSQRREPFIGRAGALLDDWMHEAGWPSDWRSRVWIDNVVRCWLVRGKKDREPLAKEIAHCTAAYPKIPESVRLVVAIGTPASNHVLGWKAGTRYAGALVRL